MLLDRKLVVCSLEARRQSGVVIERGKAGVREFLAATKKAVTWHHTRETNHSELALLCVL